jgi:hypothetical protein
MNKDSWVIGCFKTFCEISLPLGLAVAALLRTMSNHLTTLKTRTHNNVVVLETRSADDSTKKSDENTKEKAA